MILIFFQVVGDRKGAVFGGLVEAPLRPTSKKKYQVLLKHNFIYLVHLATISFYVLLTLVTEQGTNNTFVFTNKSGHPVIFRPTGTSFCILALLGNNSTIS